MTSRPKTRSSKFNSMNKRNKYERCIECTTLACRNRYMKPLPTAIRRRANWCPRSSAYGRARASKMGARTPQFGAVIRTLRVKATSFAQLRATLASWIRNWAASSDATTSARLSSCRRRRPTGSHRGQAKTWTRTSYPRFEVIKIDLN